MYVLRVHIWVLYMQEPAAVRRGIRFPELELEVVLNHHGSSATAASTLTTEPSLQP